MRILIATTFVPFHESGDRRTVRSLQRELGRRGFEADAVSLPFHLHWPDVAPQTAALRLIDLTESCGNRIDRLITIRTPAQAFRHPNKVAWFLKSREVEDFLDTPWDAPGQRVQGRCYRDMMRESNEVYLRECRKIYWDSTHAAQRSLGYSAVRPETILYAPLNSDHGYRPGPFGDYFLCGYRSDAPGDFELVLQAVEQTDPAAKLVVVGRGDRPAPLPELEARVRAAGLAERIRIAGMVSPEERHWLTANCCGAIQLAEHEDQYGESILEACHAQKPVIGLRSSSAAGEFLLPDLTGLFSDRDPIALGEAMTRLWRDRELGRELGRGGGANLTRLRVDWDRVIEKLTA